MPLVAFSLLPLWALAPALLAVARRSSSSGPGCAPSRRWCRRTVVGRPTWPAAAPGHRSPRAAGARRSSAPAASARSAVREAAEAAEVVTVAPAVEAADDATLAEPALVGTDSAVVEPVAAQVVAPAEQAYDVMVPIVDEDDIPLTWDPVPVPRPTYTMKAKAQRPEVSPAAVTPDPAPVERESDESGYDERRVAGA